MVADLFTRARITASLCAVGVALLAAALPASASNTFPGTNGKIALIDTGGFIEKLRVVTKGGHLRTVARSGKDDCICAASFSPNATHIVYSFYFGEPWDYLAIANVATGNSREISLGKLSAFSPAFLDDGRIVFSAERYPTGKHPGTYIMRRNGSGRHRIFKREQLATTPDGNWFLATDQGPASRGRWLNLLNSKGRIVRRLVSDPTHRHIFYNAAFSPNGRWIVYEKLLETHRKRIANLYLVRRDGTHRRRLTFSGRAEGPTFSPDGRWVAFKRNKGWNYYYGNIQALSVKHPGVKRWITSAHGAAFGSPTWARRKAAQPPSHGLG